MRIDSRSNRKTHLYIHSYTLENEFYNSNIREDKKEKKEVGGAT